MRWKPALTLIFITPFLTELLCTNISAPRFFHPLVFGFLMTAGYGFPVLLIRELACRWRLCVCGIFLAGFGYGIYNEGIIAKTLFLKTGVPLAMFDNYGYFFGINFTWLVFICIWHALYSVLYPILIVRYLYPDSWDKPWITGKWSVGLIALMVLWVSLMFFRVSTINGVKGTVTYLVLSLVMIAVFLGFAKSSSRQTSLIEGRPSLKYFLLGFSLFIAHVFISILLAQIKIPVLFFIIYQIVVVLFYVWFVMQKKIRALASFVLFALGGEIGTGLFGMVSLIKRNDVVAYTVHAALLFILFWAVFKVRAQNPG